MRKAFAIVGVLVSAAVAVLALTGLVLASGVTPYKGYVVNESSMDPTIPRYSFVIEHDGHYDVNQPVRLHVEGTTVTHRLKGYTPSGGTVTMGDANSAPDPWHVSPSQIDGGVVFHVPMLGWFYATFLGRMTLFVVSLAILSYLVFHRPRSSVVKAESDAVTKPATI